MQPRDAFKYHSNMFPSCWRECSKAICFWELLKAGTFVLMCGSRLIDRKDLKKLEDWLSMEWGRRSANLENPPFSNSGGKILAVAVSADVNHCECPDSLFFSQDGLTFPNSQNNIFKKNTARIAKAVHCHFQFTGNNHCHIFFFTFVTGVTTLRSEVSAKLKILKLILQAICPPKIVG